MKNTIKIFGIIAIIAVIGFSMVSCKENEPDGGDEISGTTKAKDGRIDFFYESGMGAASDCVFTTDLPAPNDSFTVVSNGYPEGKFIYGLPADQEVNWTAKIDNGKLEIKPNSTFDGQVSLRGGRK
jgi:hypothetical protein